MFCRHDWKIVMIVKSPARQIKEGTTHMTMLNYMIHGVTTLIIQCSKCTKFKPSVECLGTEIHECS